MYIRHKHGIEYICSPSHFLYILRVNTITMYISTIALLVSATAAAANCPSFPSSLVEYSSEFKQPTPPAVKPEFQTHFVQHKW